MPIAPYIRQLLGSPFALLLLTVPFWVGCEDGSLNSPDIRGGDDGGPGIFDSYVAIGNSITAGFQSGGIIDSTQSASYAAILADQMNTPFGIPRLSPPGCPPPFTQFFEDGIPAPERPPNTTDQTCALRDPAIPLTLNNVAVPRANVADVVSNSGNGTSPNPLTQFILGGRTQIEAALDANPTFASVWIGNNDVLGPALNGTDNVTPQQQFQADYTDMLDELESQSSFQGGVLIGVSNVTFVPFFTPGPVYAALKQAGQLPSNLNVNSNCNTQSGSGLTPLVPLEYGFGLIGQAQQTNQPVELDCAASDSPVLTLTEVGALAGAVQQYNAFIAEQAQQRGLAFFNPNQAFQAIYTNDDGDMDPTNDLIPKFPDRDSSQPFGAFFSLDGIHPSSATHRLVAAELVQTINETYGTSLEPPSNVPQVPSGGSS